MERFDSEMIAKFSDLLTHSRGLIVLIPHINPDGDAMGSVLGLWRVLKNKGLKVVVMSPNSFAPFYNWMTGAEDVILFNRQKDRALRMIESAEAIICMDFNQASRAAELEDCIRNFPRTKVLIDHHPYPDNFTDIMISDPGRSSTCELVYALLEEIGETEHMDTEAASSLFTGIMTDTGSFNYNVSDPATFETVSKLLAYGIDQDYIHGQIYDNYSADRLRLLGHCLHNRLTIFPEYRAAYMYLSKEDQTQFNFVKGDSEGFVNYPLSIKGIIFSAFFSENDDHVKVSFRSKGSFPVNRFSEENYNGGGHKNASGGETKLSLQEAIALFESLLPKYADQLIQDQ